MAVSLGDYCAPGCFFAAVAERVCPVSIARGPKCYLAEEMIACCSVSMVSKPVAYGSYQPFALDMAPTVKTGFKEKFTNTRRLGISRFPSLTGLFDESLKRSSLLCGR